MVDLPEIVAAGRLADSLCSVIVDHAPRFGAVAAHFPDLRKRRFIASFWAPEVLLFGDWYMVPWDTRRLSGLLRHGLDIGISGGIESASRVCPVDGRRCDGGSIPHLLRRCSDCPGSRFWSPELPEIWVGHFGIVLPSAEDAFDVLARPFEFWSPELPEVAQVTVKRLSSVIDTFCWFPGGGNVGVRTLRMLSAFLLLLCLACRKDSTRCHATDHPTGRLRCWSGGDLVFEAPTYRNGGVLCTADGVELKMTGSTDLCVEESRQADAWEPPPEGKSSRLGS